MKKMLPLVLLLIGIGAGLGAGMVMRPAPDPAPKEQQTEAPVPKPEPTGTEFVKMNNQFVVPVVQDGLVSALVVLSLSIETAEGKTSDIYSKEPKLRDSFLQVLFDHANIGGFDGAFTSAEVLDVLRQGLREMAEKVMGEGVVKDVLIVDIARQDY
jgi:hypothetical protein